MEGFVPKLNKSNINQILTGLHDGTYPAKVVSERNSTADDVQEEEGAIQPSLEDNNEAGPAEIPERSSESASAPADASESAMSPAEASEEVRTPAGTGKRGKITPAKDAGNAKERVSKKRKRSLGTPTVAKRLKLDSKPAPVDDDVEEVEVVQEIQATSPNQNDGVTLDMFQDLLKELRANRKETADIRKQVADINSAGASHSRKDLVDVLDRRAGKGVGQPHQKSVKSMSRRSRGSISRSQNSKQERINENLESGKVVKDYWDSRSKRPFQQVDLHDSKRHGPGMLRNALRNFESFSAYAESKQFSSLRNGSEIKSLCVTLDCLFNEMGTRDAAYSLTAEFIIRRICSVLQADDTGKWDHAEEIEGRGSKDILTHEQRVDYAKRATHRKSFKEGGKSHTKTKPASEKGGGDK